MHNRIAVDKTLALGSMCPMKLQNHDWSETSPHLIVHRFSFPGSIAIPACIVGKLLAWLQDRAKPPRHPWWEIEFWMHRTKNDEWVWFDDESPESFAYLPWKHEAAETMARRIMTS